MGDMYSMYCYKCGNKLEENAVFCDQCGTKQVDSPDNQIVTGNANAGMTARNIAEKKKSSGIWIVLLIIIVISLIVFAVMNSLINKQRINENENKIQEIKNSHFEFLDDMTVGDLLFEYYGDDYWNCKADGVAEFWGTNKKDNSGLALHFGSVASDNTVEVTYIKFHNENEKAHDISKDEFETYMLSLYEQLDDKYEITDTTTQSITTQTTTIQTEVVTSTTTVAMQQEKTEKSKYYLGYLSILKATDRSVKEEYSNTDNITYYNYYLYDINKDGIYELIIHAGESYGDAQVLIITIDEKSEDIYVEVGELDGGHISFIEKNGRLCTYYLQNGYHLIEEIQMIGRDGIWSLEQENVFEESGLYERLDYGTSLKGYDISDTSAVEKLCPQELLDDAYINSLLEDSLNETVEDVPLFTGIVVTETDPLNVRKSPSVNADIIGKVAKGSTVEIYSETNGWCEIRYNGQVGYVSKDFIEYE